MSYCRWSSMGFRCDVYAYADAHGGWTIHVAARKRMIPDDFADPLDALLLANQDPAAAIKRYDAGMARLDTFPFEIAPSAGATFYEPSLAAFRDRMLALRAEGLRFPDHVLEDIDDEIAEATRPAEERPSRGAAAP